MTDSGWMILNASNLPSHTWHKNYYPTSAKHPLLAFPLLSLQLVGSCCACHELSVDGFPLGRHQHPSKAEFPGIAAKYLRSVRRRRECKASIWTNNSNNELREVKRIFNQSKVLKWSALPLLVEYTYNSYNMCLQTTWVKLLRDLASSSGPADFGSLSQASHQSRPSSRYWPSSLTSNHSTRPRCHNCQTTSTC